MFDTLSQKLQEIVQKAQGNDKLTDENMQDALREIRRSLLEADVNLKVVKSFVSKVKERAIGEKVITSINPGNMLVKIVNDELKSILGNENAPLNIKKRPSIIMMMGLQGSGKTTTCAKLALKLKKEGKTSLLIAADVYRPAAQKQLEVLSKQIETNCFAIENSKDVSDIVKKGIDYAKEKNIDVIIIDTAGRLQLDSNMMAELMIINNMFEIDEKLLVIDSMIGQEAVNVASDFDSQIGITGIILTKLDGDTRGGAALSVVYCTNKPIKLTGNGEKLESLNDFYPDRMASRILGMGDVVSLVEKAKEVFDAKESKELEKKLRKSGFTFNDFLKIKKQMKAFGSIGNLLSMLPIPNLNKDMKDLISHEGEKQLNKIEVFISSMTPYERENPDVINASRKKRIAKGCGLSINEVNDFVNQFNMMRKMMKGVPALTKKFKHAKGKFHPNMLNKF